MSEQNNSTEASKLLFSQQVSNLVQGLQFLISGDINNHFGQLAKCTIYLAKELDVFHQLEKAIVEQSVTLELVGSVMDQLQELRRKSMQEVNAAAQVAKQTEGTV